MQRNNHVPSSYVRPLSPAKQYQELNTSLARQVQDTRRNLLGTLNDAGSRPSSVEEEFDGSEPDTKDVVAKSGPSTDANVGEECIKVFLRIRPFSTEEVIRNEDKNCFEVRSSIAITAHPPPESTTFKNQVKLYGPEEREHNFAFSRVFPGNATQHQFFEATTQQYICNVVSGQDALIFSYGVTNGGKTFTLQGTEMQPGIVPRALNLLFYAVKDKLIDEPNLMPRMFCDYEQLGDRRLQELAASKAALWKILDSEESEALSARTMVSSLSSDGASVESSQSSWFSAFDGTSSLQDTQCSNITIPASFRCSIWVSFYEIYNEQVYDLLVPFSAGKAKDRPTLKVSEDKRGNVYVKGGGEFYVESAEEAIKLAAVGRRNLQIAATKLNYNSSRSHCVYAIRIMKEFNRPDGTLGFQISRLSFCDLAGSERTSKIEGGGERVKETGSINASLLTLGRCIRLLRWNQTHRNQPQVIPYRESKLTRLFQPYLNGRAKACMIVNINQCGSSFDETLNVLKFSAIAKEVKTVKDLAAVTHNLPAAVVSPPPPKFSLLLNEFRDRKRTVGWSGQGEVPATVIKKPLAQPLPDEDEKQTSETNILDRTLDQHNEIIQQYLIIIEDLKTRLISEKQRNLLLEVEIREEVCNEYGHMFRSMEKHYRDDRDEAVADAEQLAEDRLEMFIKTVRKRRKTEGRVTMNEDEDETENDDDAWVPAENLKAKQKECEDLREELERLKQESASGNDKSGAGTSTGNEIIDEVVALKGLLEKQEQKIRDLTDTVDEAAKIFEEQRNKIQSLEQENDTMKKALESKDDNDPDVRLDHLNGELVTLKRENEELREQLKNAGCTMAGKPTSAASDTSTSQDSTKPMEMDTSGGSGQPGSLESDEGFKLIELESKIFDLERSLESANKRAEDLKSQKESALEKREEISKQLSNLESQLHDGTMAKERLEKMQNEIDQLKFSEEILVKEKLDLNEQLNSKSKSIDCMKEEIEKLKSRQVEMESELESSKERFESVSSQKEAVEGTLRQNLEKMLDMQKKLKDTETALTESKSEKEQIQSAHDQQVQQVQEAVANTQQELDSLRSTVEEYQKEKTVSDMMLKNVEEEAAQLMSKVKQVHDKKLHVEKELDEMKQKAEEEKRMLVEKISTMEKETSEYGQLKASVKELEEKLDQERRGSMEEGNRWRQELEQTKSALVNLKREKLDLLEASKWTENECKRLLNELKDKEEQLKEEKDKNTKIVEDMEKNQQAIQSYKAAMQEVDGVTEKYEEVLTRKNQELEHIQKELSALNEKSEMAQKNFILEQQKALQLENDLKLKIEEEKSLKTEISNLQTKITEKDRVVEEIGKKLEESESRFQQSSQSNSAVMTEMDYLKSANDLLRNVNETLKKEAQGRETRLAEFDSRLTGAKKQVNELQQAVATKKVELEEANRAQEESRNAVQQLELRFRSAEDERSSLVETVRQLKAENEKLTAASVAPPTAAAGGRRRGGKMAGMNLQTENADEVEVTPMASKPSRKKTADESKKESTSDNESSPNIKGGKSSRTTKTSAKNRHVNDDDDTGLDATSASMASPTKVTTKAPRKTRAKASSEDDTTSQLPLLNFPFPLDGPVSNTGRPQRRAAQIASNGIVAVNEFWRNSSPNSIAAFGDSYASVPAGGASTSRGAADVPLKKRRRELMKDPTVPVCSPALDEKLKPKTTTESAMDAVTSTLKKLNPRKKK